MMLLARKIRTLSVTLIPSLLTLTIANTPVHAQTELDIRELSQNDLRRVAFSLDDYAEIHVEAVGAGLKSGEYLFAYPWIIDARTRDLVWSMDEEITDAVSGSKWLRGFEDDITLQRGSYELYFYAGPPYYYFGNFPIGNLEDLLKGLGDWVGKAPKDYPDDDEVDRKLTPKYFVRLTSQAELRDDPAGLPLAPISIVRPGNDSYQKVAFSLSADCELSVYCLGEFAGSAESMVDGGWIVDARSHSRVWEMTEENTDHAGGAKKNRRFHANVRLGKGDYLAFYVTDDSHTWDDWNSPPPVDPHSWGLQVFPVHTADAAKIALRPMPTDEMPLLRMTGVGDNELLSEAFRLDSPASIRVYAIGEWDNYSDEMADYAWITRVDSRQKVWLMSGSNTDPAGGASKNRQFDGLIDLAAGEYLVHYATDGSHSEGSGWNSSPPYDQKAYGVSIYAPSPDFDRSHFVLIDRRDVRPKGTLAAILEAGDDVEESRRFTLTSPTRVRIHALGEGDRSEMVDYGWIEDARTGDVVWEMTYRKTSHAGGADKNREVDQVILLDKGEYIVHYVTDDSHAFNDWNSDAPDDPMGWGIIISEAGKTEP